MGPLVIGVATIEKAHEDKLLEIGVKDSKMLTPKQRSTMFGQLNGVCKEFSTVHIPAEELDGLMNFKSLNEIEAMRIGKLLNSLKDKPQVVYVDSADIVEANFAKRIKKYLNFDTIVIAEHKADVNYPVVSAASIVAKVERDAAIDELAKKFGKLGSGYSHDEVTIKFLREWISKHKSLPSFARRAWITNQNLLDESFQKKIFEM